MPGTGTIGASGPSEMAVLASALMNVTEWAPAAVSRAVQRALRYFFWACPS
jgi:hypothetical protein